MCRGRRSAQNECGGERKNVENSHSGLSTSTGETQEGGGRNREAKGSDYQLFSITQRESTAQPDFHVEVLIRAIYTGPVISCSMSFYVPSRLQYEGIRRAAARRDVYIIRACLESLKRSRFAMSSAMAV